MTVSDRTWAPPEVGSTVNVVSNSRPCLQNERVSWHRLADRRADRPSATADGHDEAVLRSGTDAAAIDLELLERGRQKAARAVVLTIVPPDSGRSRRPERRCAALLRNVSSSRPSVHAPDGVSSRLFAGLN